MVLCECYIQGEKDLNRTPDPKFRNTEDEDEDVDVNLESSDCRLDVCVRS